MIHRTQALLRLSGRPKGDAPETKSTKHEAAGLFRRFFVALEKLERARRGEGKEKQHEG
ncbi:MAG: hypothetical protein ACRC7C_11295 [Beijerinckiaceae bacterium]